MLPHVIGVRFKKDIPPRDAGGYLQDNLIWKVAIDRYLRRRIRPRLLRVRQH